MKIKWLICLNLIIAIILSGCKDNNQHEPVPNTEGIISNGTSTDIIDSSIDAPKTAHFRAEMTDIVWDSLNIENSRFQNKEDFIFEVEGYIKEISKFLNRENWFEVYKEKHGDDYICNVDYRLTSEASHVENGYNAYSSLIPNVYLKKDFFEHDLAPIAHETTHIIAPFYSSLSFREGLASYCQDKFGKNPSVFNWGLDAHAYSNLYLIYAKEEFDKLFPVIGTIDTLQNAYSQGDSRDLFYNLSYSFTKYLIDNFGIDKFMKLYESDDLINDYTAVCEKSFETIKNDWYKSLELFSEPLSVEEIQQYTLELFTEHKYSTK